MQPDTIDQFCEFHHNYHDIGRGRRQQQRKALRDLVAHAGKEPELLEAQDLQDYLATLVASGKMPSTVAFELGMIRPFVKWMWRQKLISGDTLLEMREVRGPRGARGGPRPYKRREIEEFWRQLHAKYPDPEPERWMRNYERGVSKYRRVYRHAKRLQAEAIFALALDGMLRRQEIWTLDLRDMDPENEYLVVRGAAKNPDGVSRERAVPWMTPYMRQAVGDWLDFRGRILQPDHGQPWVMLFDKYRGKKMWRSDFYHLPGTIGTGWEFHRFRHTGATEALRAGVPVDKLQKILGHANVEQTLRYAELVKGDIVDAARRSEGRLSYALRSAA